MVAYATIQLDEEDLNAMAVKSEQVEKNLIYPLEYLNYPKYELSEQEKEKVVDLKISKHIDENYISDDEIRIAMHQEINKVRSRIELNRLINEFNDRYGRVNDELKIYVEGKYYSVENNVFYPFGDANGVEGVQIYVNGDNIRVK